jgi:hypothetical protein
MQKLIQSVTGTQLLPTQSANGPHPFESLSPEDYQSISQQDQLQYLLMLQQQQASPEEKDH